MNFNQKRFQSLLPGFFPSLIKAISAYGFVPTFVGGVVRDFLMTEELGHDWDIELSHPTLAFNKDTWKAFGKSMAPIGRASFLSYDIIRLEVQDYSIEFSPPRREIFEAHLADKGHSNFSVEFDLKMPFREAVARRDFTINAMGLRCQEKEFEFLDPLEGLRHLREKTLHPAGADFHKDPVRFLRALRFARRFEFHLSPTLEDILKSMDIKGISPTYLWSEMQKSKDPVGLYQDLIQWAPLHPELHLPVGEELIPHLPDFKRVLTDPGFHEAWMIALEWVGIACESWQKYFGQSSDLGRRLGRWARSCLTFQKILPETFHGEFEEIRERPEFEALFDWYFTTKQLLQKNPKLPLLSMVEEFLPEWIHLYRFEPVKDVKHIDPPFRAKYQVWNLCQRL